MLGMVMSVIAGAAMSLQGVMNTRLGEKIGIYESNVWVQGTAFLLGTAAMFLVGKGNWKAIADVPKGYLLGGALGIIITVTVMLSVRDLQPASAVSVILISQLLTAAIIEALGLMGTEKAAFIWTKYLGLAMMIGGVIVFKLRL